MKKDGNDKKGASGVETDIPGTEHYGAGHRTLVDAAPADKDPSEENTHPGSPNFDSVEDLSGVPGQTNDSVVTERISVQETAAAPGADNGTQDGNEEIDESAKKFTPSGAKWLAGGLVALLLFALVVGYFVSQARPSQVAKANHPVPTVTPPASPAPAIKVEGSVPLPIGVDATACRPDQMIVDREHHALRFPASCSKLIFDEAGK